jgi:hypothetical protein
MRSKNILIKTFFSNIIMTFEVMSPPPKGHIKNATNGRGKKERTIASR